MTSLPIKSKVLEEIDRIPEENLLDLYHFIHDFRIGVERSRRRESKQILEFAGSWSDMPDAEFNDFAAEVEERRSQAFTQRRDNEGIFD